MKPMLASKAPALETLTYPVLASPKIDGIRCLVRQGGLAVSRSLKPIPNEHIRFEIDEADKATGGLLIGLDGELWIPSAKTFGECSGPIMRRTGEPAFEYHVFDLIDVSPSTPFAERFQALQARVSALHAYGVDWIKLVPHEELQDEGDVDYFEAKCLERGWEGTMLRSPDGPYKFGRSTAKQGYLLKLKRFEDAEAVVIGMVEEQENLNEAKTNALGRTERSSHAEGKRGKGTMGKLLVRGVGGAFDGVEFSIGTGFDAAERQRIWDRSAFLVDGGAQPGAIVKYRYQAHGAKDKPRCPAFLGFRHADDM